MVNPTGSLLVYLGAAPGVGKTTAMLKEGGRRAKDGQDVVVAYLELHGRPAPTAAAGLEVVPPLAPVYRGLVGRELDVDGVLARRPRVALVDELAHTNLPGSGRGNEKRWQDVALLLAGGIDVVSTLNVQHIASLGGEVERITGLRQRETVPDEFLAHAAVRLIDMEPTALRRRLLALHAPDEAERALAHHFRLANLEALRWLTHEWVDAWAAARI